MVSQLGAQFVRPVAYSACDEKHVVGCSILAHLITERGEAKEKKAGDFLTTYCSGDTDIVFL